MKNKVLLSLVVGLFCMISAQLSAQSVSPEGKSSKVEVQEKVDQPTPSMSTVKYAPGQEPTIDEQIKALEKKLKTLQAIPKEKRISYVETSIQKIETALTLKKKEKAAQTKDN